MADVNEDERVLRMRTQAQNLQDFEQFRQAISDGRLETTEVF